ncbi:Long-chain-fatty-acid--CoA ligase [hydrothermal vent metagenome]|uniref:Long-chain-fatty-acid--CoA ligase n=1 Tax=hydrothermal vent metagenome TaxID=652676 RepID=A0A3B0YA18_9ZZZZ
MKASLLKLFLDSVEHFPDREAIVYGEQRVSYRELSSQAGAVSTFLRAQKLEPGARVGILLDNSPEYAAIYYGVLAAGGVVVGLNTAAKARDLANWLQHAGADWLFAESRQPELSSLLDRLSGSIGIVDVGEASCDSGRANLGALPFDDKAPLCIPDFINENSLASIIYTSGTTGQPKGVMLTHSNLHENICSILEYLKLDEQDRVLNVLPFYYSYGNSVLHTHLAVGGTVILENSLLYPRNVLTRLVEEKATGFSGVPSTYSLLLNRTELADYDLSSLRYLTQAGGAMAPVSIQRLREQVPHADFFIMYGQTEASARLSYLPPEMLDAKMGSIGIAIPGVTLEVRNEQGKIVRSGETGEIWATGKNIMNGYWQDEGLSCEVLHEGWLKTGDLAYCDDEGYLFIVGRSSEMIKSGAHRISPKEIEEVILELDGVEEIAAVGVPDDMLGQIIKVVVVVASGYDLQKRNIQAHCKKNLASYKIPKQVEFVNEIPRTASGKVRRFMLQEPLLEQT